jgi:hypothetical protein
MPGSPTDTPGTVALTVDHYLWFVDRALDEMVRIVEELGDEGANRTPDLPGANSAYVILAHCLGVMEYWGGATVADRTFTRDRAAEFAAQGPVADLVAQAVTARRRLAEDLAGLDSMAAPANVFANPEHPHAYDEAKGSVLVHILEELYQHLGQVQLTRDVLTSAG